MSGLNGVAEPVTPPQNDSTRAIPKCTILARQAMQRAQQVNPTQAFPVMKV